jgi:hypothetical protein
MLHLLRMYVLAGTAAAWLAVCLEHDGKAALQPPAVATAAAAPHASMQKH